MSNILDFTHDEIFPYVVVYKHLIPDKEFLFSIIKTNVGNGNKDSIFSEWLKWYEFGEKIEFNGDINYVFGDQTNTDILLQKILISRNSAIRLAAFSHYFAKYNVPHVEDMHIQAGFQIAKYKAGMHIDEDGKLSMIHHTDFDMNKIDVMSENFYITANIYYNDDYDGGGLEFTNTITSASYKPKAGDVIVFPSGSPFFPHGIPYFHAVYKVEKSEKYFTRNYVMYTHSPRPNEKEFNFSHIDFENPYAGPNQLLRRENKLTTQSVLKKYYKL